MKRSFLYITLGLVVLFSSISPLFISSGTASAAQNKAQQYCQQNAPQQGRSGQPSAQGLAWCEAAYNAGFSNKDVAQACPSSTDGFPAPDPNNIGAVDGVQENFLNCETYWAAGSTAAGRAVYAPSPGAGSKSGSEALCQQYFVGSYLGACNTGFAKPKSSLSSVCKSGADYNACLTGYGWAGGNTNINTGGGSRGTQTTDAAATANCNGQSGSSLTACLAGYTGGHAGTAENTACSAFTGSDLSECQTAYGAGKSAASPAPAGGAATKQIGCDVQFTNPLTWIVCPVVSMLSDFINIFDSIITNQLDVKTDAIFCSTSATCNAYYTAWQSFRDIALGLMAIAGLVIVIAQALGLEILDAYTIRRVLPRLLVAAIGISLSWPLMKFAIQLSDDLGFGIRHLIYAPFSQLNDSVNLSFGGSIGNFFFGSLAVGGAAVAAIPAWLVLGGPAALLLFALSAALAVAVAVATLILRQVLIIVMMLLAPIAIIAYVLPNTQRLYRLWWESFSKVLLMFPLIAAIIAAGRVFSAVTFNNGGFFNQLIGFVAYFAPYFMIPATFRLAGTAMSGLSNVVNSRAASGFNALGKARANNRQKRIEINGQKFKTGGFKPIIPARFGRLNRLNRAAVNVTNSVGRRYNAGLIRGGLGFGARGETALEESLMEGGEAAGKEPAMRENATINGFNRLMVLMARRKGDETAAMSDLREWYGEDQNEYNRPFQGHELEEKLTDAQARLRNVGGYNPGRAVAAYLAMGRDGTAIRDVRDSGQVAAWVSEGSTATAYNLVSQVASDSKRVGRSELSPSQENKAALVDATVRAHRGETVPDLDRVINRATMSGAGGEGAYTVLMSAPSRVVRGNVEHAMEIIQRHQDDPSAVPFEDAAQAAAVIEDLKTNVDREYGKVDNRIAFRQAMAVEGREKLLDNFYKSRAPTTETVTDDFGNVQTVTRTRDLVDDHGNAVETGPRAASQVDGASSRGAAVSDEQRHALMDQQERERREREEQDRQQP